MIHRHKHEMTLKFPSIKTDTMLSGKEPSGKKALGKRISCMRDNYSAYDRMISIGIFCAMKMYISKVQQRLKIMVSRNVIS